MLWAFARDGAVPGHRWISKVNSLFCRLEETCSLISTQVHVQSSLPLVSIAVSVIVNMLFALINIGSSAAFSAFTSLAVAGCYISFVIPAALLTWKKISGQKLRYGSFKLGRAGIPITVYALAYSIIGVFFSFGQRQCRRHWNQ